MKNPEKQEEPLKVNEVSKNPLQQIIENIFKGE